MWRHINVFHYMFPNSVKTTADENSQNSFNSLFSQKLSHAPQAASAALTHFQKYAEKSFQNPPCPTEPCMLLHTIFEDG